MNRAAPPARAGLLGFLLILLSGCAATQPVARLDPDFNDPFAIPLADSIDAEWVADTTRVEPQPTRPPKPRKKKGVAPATAAESAPVAEVPPVVTPPPGGEPTTSEPKPPQLTVRLSAGETARLDERIQADLARAERALAALRELRLSGEPADQVAAARRFVTDARAARAARDYVRGAELAEKARVLAEAVRATAIR